MKNLGSDLLKTDNKKPEIKTTNQKSAKKENENKNKNGNSNNEFG